jgi:hypothetical protein
MAWTQGRETRKEEDQIYCLLGLFAISMPLIYGEGLVCAERRLREEIIKNGNIRERIIILLCSLPASKHAS